MKVLVTNIFMLMHIGLSILISFLTIPILLTYIFMDFTTEDGISYVFKLLTVVYMAGMAICQIYMGYLLGMKTSY